MQVMPQAPRMDPNVFAPDAEKTLRVAHSGLLLSQEIANLQNKRAERELQAAKIAADSAKLKYEMRLIEDAELRLPQVHQAALAKLEQERAASDLARVEAQALMSVNVPQKAAELKGSELSNAATTSQANKSSGFSSLNTPGQAQALTAAQTLGGYGIASGGIPDGEVPLPFRKTEIRPEIDPQTGNTVERTVTIDSRNGRIIERGDVVGTTKLGVDEKSVSASMKDAEKLVSTKGIAQTLRDKLTKYAAAKQGGLLQAAATNAANAAPTGPISVVKKALGASLQSDETVEITGAIQNLKNTIANDLFGSALSKEESANLQGMLPTAEDLVDPKRALQKLKSTEEFLDAKLKPYVDRGVIRKSGLVNSEAAPAPAAKPAAAGTSPAMQVLQRGGTVLYKGVPHKLGTLPDGRPGLVPAQ